MKAVELSRVSALEPHVRPASEEPFLLTKNGEVVAAVVPVDEQDAENMLLSINPKFVAILERSRQRLEAEGGLSSAEVRQKLGLPASGSEPIS